MMLSDVRPKVTSSFDAVRIVQHRLSLDEALSHGQHREKVCSNTIQR